MTPEPRRARRTALKYRRRRIAVAVVASSLFALTVVLTILVIDWIRGDGPVQAQSEGVKSEASVRASPAETPTPTPTETVPPAPADGIIADIDDRDSVAVVVNKRRPIADAANYAPRDLVDIAGGWQLRSDAAEAINRMISAAAEDGIGLVVRSAYRPFSSQTRLYNQYVAADGQAAADTYSARPGHSEHQTGLAADILDSRWVCDMRSRCLADQPEGKWLAEHAWEYGFILRYPEGLDHITGYTFEPWHFRFVGDEIARRYTESGVATLEEFWSLPAAPDYQ